MKNELKNRLRKIWDRIKYGKIKKIKRMYFKCNREQPTKKLVCQCGSKIFKSQPWVIRNPVIDSCFSCKPRDWDCGYKCSKCGVISYI